MQDDHSVTGYLAEVKEGNELAYNKVYELVYDDLKKIAHQRLVGLKKGDTLNTTALVHESFLKLVNSNESGWKDRAHFYAVASRAMRFILVDYIRNKTAKKRGEGKDVEMLDEEAVSTEQRLEEFISLNMALEKLMEWNERLGKLVEYRFIGGMSYEEISEVTGISEPTLKRDWVRARTWLYNTMKEMQGLK
jgi:RNA polymerase sigma factor (TIGR02999 family)